MGSVDLADSTVQPIARDRSGHRLTDTRRRIRRYRLVYAIMAPALVWLILFRLFPILGNAYAFVDYSPMRGLFGSEWVGLRYFRELLESVQLWRLLRNTLVISGMRLAFGFPWPIALAILIYDIPRRTLRRAIQSTVYLPHFLSWPVVAAVTFRLLSPTEGLINVMLEIVGAEPVFFMTKPELFRGILVIQGIWKEAGWGTVLYLAALSSVDPNLYESAMIDGASRWQRIRFVTLPAISGTIIILLILTVGNMINENFQQIFLMINPLLYEVGDVFETFVFRRGIRDGQFSYTTAVGFFKSIVAFVMIVGANSIARRTREAGLF